MHKLALAAVLASCGLPYQPLDDPPPVPRDAGADAATDAPAVIAAPLAIARPPLQVHSLHGAALRALAVTEDGTLAVSADIHGSLRWWPSLDGRREPIVVTARPATTLAIVHDGDGGAFAAIDTVGQIEIVRVGADGEVRARATPELARPAVEIRAVDAVFLVRCDDGAIVRVEADGRRSGELRPAPHQHVTALAARRGAVLAIVDTGGEMHGRWLDPAKMRWGELTPAMNIDGTRVVDGTHVELSPGHRTIAATTGGGEDIDIIDLANGWRVSTAVANTFVDPLLRPIGFQTDDALAISQFGSVMWDDKTAAIATGIAAITDSGIVAETGGGLVIQDATTKQSVYIGYQLTTPLHVHALASGGWLATDGGTLTAIDERLHTARAYDLADVAGYKYAFYDVRIIDDRHAIASGYSGSGQDLYLFDLEHGTATEVGAGIGVFDYDAPRRVVGYRTEDAFVFAQYDGKHGAFDALASLPFSGNSTVMHFLDPGKTHDLAVVIDTEYGDDVGTTATITRIHAIRSDGTLDLGKIKTVKLSRTWWRTNGNVDSLAGPGWTPASSAVVRPSPDGTLVAQLAGDRVTLRDTHGGERWSAPAMGASDLVWSKTGVLAGYGGGMARFDISTGDIDALQCGWRFGKWTKPAAVVNAAAMCEQSWTGAE